MNSKKCKLNLMILRTDLAIGYTNFMIWFPYSQFHNIISMKIIFLIYKEWYIMDKIL